MPHDVVIDDRGQVIESAWQVLADEAAWPESGPVVVPLARLLDAPAEAFVPGAVGALLEPHSSLDALAPLLPRLALVAVSFPKFRDGRGFTQARALREHHGFAGDIRAVGHTLPDQYLALLRCGVSSVALASGQDPAVWAAVLALRGGLDATPVAERPVPLLRRLAAAFQA